MLKRIRFLIFPAILLLIVLALSFFHIHGSSIGEFHKIMFSNQEDQYLLFGTSRGIRSDEWMAGTPQIVFQYLNNFPVVNEDIAEGVNLGYGYGAPTKSIFSIFKPQLWVFFLIDNINFSFSFFWWFRVMLLIVAVYLLLLEITKKKIRLSILGSLLFLFTPFVQWWLGFDTITMLCFGLFFFIKLIKENIFYKRLLYAVGLTYSLISFTLTLYPPFQISLAWVAIFLGVGIMIQYRKSIFKGRKRIKEEKPEILKLLFVGRLIKTKGVYELIETCKVLKDRGFKYSLTIIGDGSERDSLQKIVEECNLEQNVLLKGQLPFDVTQEEYQIHDVLVNPSYTEGFGLTVLEAVANNLLVVATDVGGISEIIPQNKLLKVEEISPKKIANKIEDLYKNWASEQKQLKDIINKNLDKFSWNNNIKKYLSITNNKN